jgi:hypothetical protein
MKTEHIKILIFAIAISFVMVVAFYIWFGKSEVRNEKGNADITETVCEETMVTAAEEIPEEEGEKEAVDCRVAYDSFTKLQMEKIYTETVDTGNGKQTMQYKTYYLSDVDISSGNDTTADYTQAVGTEAFDSSKISDISFEEAFGFSYTSCNDLYEVMERARVSMGFDADYETASLDGNKKNLLGEESYVYEKDCSILEQLLEKVDYDTLIQKKCAYSVTEMDGIKYPASFTAVVQYVKGNVTYTKTAYLGFAGENIDELSEEENACNSNDICGTCGETGECSQGCGGSCCE